MAEPTYSFSPYWLMSLEESQRREVQEWLSRSGVNIDLCPGFDYDGHTLTTRYYQINENGQAQMGSEGPIYESGLRMFHQVKAPPKAVQARMQVSRDA
jgi:hypothetical protein